MIIKIITFIFGAPVVASPSAVDLLAVSSAFFSCVYTGIHRIGK